MAVAGLVLVASDGLLTAGSGGETVPPPTPDEVRAERADRRLAADPDNEGLQRASMKAWIFAANDRLSRVNRGSEPVPAVVAEDLKRGLGSWRRYLHEVTRSEIGGEIAEIAGDSYFQLVEIGSTIPSEAEANAAGAAQALRIAGRLRPTLFTLSNVAVYEYFNGEYAAGDKAAIGAARDAPIDRKGVIEQLDEYRERGEKFQARLRRGAEELRESGEDELDTPIKGYGSPGGINGREPSS